jgi:hypothetical protein
LRCPVRNIGIERDVLGKGSHPFYGKSLFLIEIEGVSTSNGKGNHDPLLWRDQTEVEVLNITSEKTRKNKNDV